MISVAPGLRPATASSQSVVRSLSVPSFASAQSASLDVRVSPVLSRNPSLSSSSKQTSCALQSSSIPLPMISVAPGLRPAAASSQSVVRSELVPSFGSVQSASLDVRVSPVLSRNPSLSSSSKQTSCPLQFSSIPLPAISVAFGLRAAAASSQSVVRSVVVPSFASAQSASVDVRVSPVLSRKPSLSSSSKHSSWALQSSSIPLPMISVAPGLRPATLSSQSVVRSVFVPSFGSRQSTSVELRVSPRVSR